MTLPGYRSYRAECGGRGLGRPVSASRQHVTGCCPKGVDMAVRFNAPPGWPAPSASWAPTDDWMPDPSWPPPPADWEFWTVVDQRAEAPAGLAARDGGAASDASVVAAPPRFGMPPRSTAATYGTDRGSWLAGLRARVAGESAVPAAADPEPGVKQAPRTSGKAVVDSAWEIDGLLTSAGR